LNCPGYGGPGWVNERNHLITAMIDFVNHREVREQISAMTEVVKNFLLWAENLSSLNPRCSSGLVLGYEMRDHPGLNSCCAQSLGAWESGGRNTRWKNHVFKDGAWHVCKGAE